MRHSEETWTKVDELRARGYADPEISRRTGIPRSTIYMHFRRQGAPSGGPSAQEPQGGVGWLGLAVAALFLLVEFLGSRRASGRPSAGRARSRPGSPRQAPHQALWRPESS